MEMEEGLEATWQSSREYFACGDLLCAGTRGAETHKPRSEAMDLG